jgi:signal transduction histidine kinase
LVAVIAIILFVQTWTAETITLRIFDGLSFVLFLILGYILIQGVLREIHYREELQTAYEDLKKLDEAKSEFISIASHQLRTPLSAIKGYISLLLEGTYGQLEEKAKKPLGNVYQANERLVKLVNDLLNISRIEGGRVKLQKEMVDIGEVALNVVSLLKIEAQNKGISLKLEKPKEPILAIRADKEKISQALLNLIDNAIRYTEKGGVTIRLSYLDNQIQVEVKDTGAGLEPSELQELFQSFSRGQAGSRFWTEGMGLGLYVAKKFVELHNGRIRAESEGRDKGASFFVELPVA